MSIPRTRLCAVTRLTHAGFWRESMLGQSLRAFPESLRPELALRFENQGERALGLSAVYNQALESCPSDRHLLLVHDDVWLHDVFLQQRIHEGLQQADVIGLAGSRGSDPRQPSWGLAFNEQLEGVGWQTGEHTVLSGAVSHGQPAPERAPKVRLSLYGPVPHACDLLDGLFLALDVNTVRTRGVRFDEQFAFHFYDLDFCATARLRGLQLSTWPILVTHGSGGNFSSPEWRAAAKLYLGKWRELDQAFVDRYAPEL